MTYAKKLLFEAITKAEMARELQPELASDIDLAIGCLWSAICNEPASTTASRISGDKHGTKDSPAITKVRRNKRKPGRADDFKHA